MQSGPDEERYGSVRQRIDTIREQSDAPCHHAEDDFNDSKGQEGPYWPLGYPLARRESSRVVLQIVPLFSNQSQGVELLEGGLDSLEPFTDHNADLRQV